MATRATVLGLLLAGWIALVPGCGSEPDAWGEPVDPAVAVRLSKLLSDTGIDPEQPVTASGRISEVCRTSGCWFVLQDVVDGKLHEVLVDLLPRAEFTVPSSVAGRNAMVQGWIVGEEPDRKLEAVGLGLE